MTNFTIITLFPQIMESFFTTSIFSKAVKNNIVSYKLLDIRSYSQNGRCDDTIYGGGAGMLLKPQPLFEVLSQEKKANSKVILPSPSGKLFKQSDALLLSKENDLIFLCPRYEGVDQRVIDKFVDYEYSIGDYILSCGDTATMVMIDSIYRLIDNVINNESLLEESYNNNLLEYPQYTKPSVYQDMKVPEILLSGNHQMIKKWRLEQSIIKTKKNRPDLLNDNTTND